MMQVEERVSLLLPMPKIRPLYWHAYSHIGHLGYFGYLFDNPAAAAFFAAAVYLPVDPVSYCLTKLFFSVELKLAFMNYQIQFFVLTRLIRSKNNDLYTFRIQNIE